jgi:hypothetical protein
MNRKRAGRRRSKRKGRGTINERRNEGMTGSRDKQRRNRGINGK